MTDNSIIAAIIARATDDGADPSWTAAAIIDTLRRRGWRKTTARPAPDWHINPATITHTPPPEWHQARHQLDSP